MKRILILIIGLIGVAYGQYSPTSAKSRFVNGLALGTKLDSYFNTADSNAIYWRADSVVMAKYKGTARALAFASALGSYKLVADTFFTAGYTTRARTKQQIDSLGSSVDSLITPYNTLSIANRPVFIDQFVNNFYGRGMLTAEPINTVTEQLIGSNAAAGVDNIRVADTSKFKVGGLATIKHTNGLYETYFITSKGGDGLSGTIGIHPALKYSVTTASRIERTWFNKAHPGKFYMRQLAQQIANGTEINTAIPTGNRILYTNFSDTPALSKDTMIALGGSSVSYFPASNTGVDSASPIRFILGNTPYISIATAGDGAETPLFYIDRPAQAIASVAFSSSNNANAYSIQIINDSGRAVAVYKIPTTASKKAFTIYKFPFVVSLSNKLKVRVIADTVTATANLSIAQIDVFEQSAVNKKIIAKQKSVIVGLGDSWMAGDLGSTAEREPITQQLAIELPYATIINAGVGGNTIRNMLDRFDTDVAPYNPDYVILETGTNDCYNPASSVFYPNAVNDWLDVYNQLIHKVLAIGAKPIILGVPALAQSDADVPTWPEWLLNDRARIYAQKFYRYLSKQTSDGGDYEWKLNVSDTAAMLAPYFRNTIQTNQGGTGRTTWTAGTIPVIGSGTGNPFVDLNNRFFFDSSSSSLLVGGNTRYYNAQFNLGVYNVPKIAMAATGGYTWSTYVDSINQKYRLRYEEGAIDPFIMDRSGNAEYLGSGSFGGTVRGQANGAQFRISGGGTDAGIWMTNANNILKIARWSDGANGIDLDVGTGDATIANSLTTKKIIGNSSTPSISGGSATYIGTGATTSVSGNDMAGEITLVTGTGCTSTGASNRSALTVTFASAYASAPTVIIQAIQRGGLNTTDGPSEAFFLRRDAVGATAFTVYLPIGVTLTDSTTYDITYHVIGK